MPPYAAGAGRSGLFPLLARGHHGVKLSREDWDKLACWIDLLVPYCGDYLEAHTWSPAELRAYDQVAARRKQVEDQERAELQQRRKRS